MTRRRADRSLLAALLMLTLLAGLSVPGAAVPAQAAPQDGAGPGEALITTHAVSAANEPSGRFGFGSVLGQATATATFTPTSTSTTTPTSTSTTTPTSTRTTTPTSTSTGVVTATSTSTPTIGVPPTQPPSGTPGVPCATTVGQSCTVTGAVNGTWTKTGSGTFSFTAQASGAQALVGVQPTIFVPTTANANGEQFACSVTTLVGGATTTTCAGTTAGDILQGATLTVAFPALGGGFVTSTGVVTGANAANNLTLTQAQTQAQGTAGFLLGTPGVPCATLGSTLAGQVLVPGINQTAVGQTCTVTGAVTGTLTRTGSMSFTLTATVPAGLIAGITPVAVFSTDLGIQAVACAAPAAGAGGTSHTCTGTITGNALQGSTVALCFTATTTCLLGTVTGPGPVIVPNNLPLLPPPPLQLLPPPPPPLPLPLPPLPPPPAALAPPVAPIAPAALPGVPVVPEADSILLLLGGMAAVAGVAALRRRRRIG